MTPHNALHTVVMSSVQAISLITGPIQVTRDAQIEPARLGNITLWSYNLVPNSSQAMIFFLKIVYQIMSSLMFVLLIPS